MSNAQTLPGRLRLKSQRDFRSVYQRGARAGGDWLVVVVMRRRRDDPHAPSGPRLGVSVSKEHGGAVRRNKLKRLFREAFRLERDRLPQDVDVVLIPRVRPEPVPLVALRQELPRLLQRALQKPVRGPQRGAQRGPQRGSQHDAQRGPRDPNQRGGERRPQPATPTKPRPQPPERPPGSS